MRIELLGEVGIIKETQVFWWTFLIHAMGNEHSVTVAIKDERIVRDT